mmetsp:Transcript_22496/g.32920  ORF Transcript_22496/g.32920 Transcript_22496/m.32920 type:complete len:95 (+) Transcript_22496:38-322(+)
MCVVGKTSLLAILVLVWTTSIQPANGMAPFAVPERMLLNASMRAADIGKAMLTALQFDTTAIIVDDQDTSAASKVIQSHTGKHGSICFVVRRPG